MDLPLKVDPFVSFQVPALERREPLVNLTGHHMLRLEARKLPRETNMHASVDLSVLLKTSDQDATKTISIITKISRKRSNHIPSKKKASKVVCIFNVVTKRRLDNKAKAIPPQKSTPSPPNSG
jgi:hypothetical protein